MVTNFTRRLFSQSFLQIKGITHYPVLHREVTSLVDKYIANTQEDKDYYQMADCTFGGGNHSVPLLNKYANLRVLGVDLDEQVLEACQDNYKDLIK